MAGGVTQRPHFSQAYKRNPMWPSAQSKLGLIKFQNFMGFWAKSGATYGASLLVLGLFFLDYEPIVSKIPLYNRKFKQD